PAVVGGRIGRLVTGFINLSVAFPTLLVAIFVAAIVGVGARGAVAGIAVAVAPYFARLTQTLSSSVAGSDYLAAARLLRVGPPLPRPAPLPDRRGAAATPAPARRGGRAPRRRGAGFSGAGRPAAAIRLGSHAQRRAPPDLRDADRRARARRCDHARRFDVHAAR